MPLNIIDYMPEQRGIRIFGMRIPGIVRAINLITVAGALGLNLTSVWPGLIEGWIACVALPVVALLAIGWAIAVSVWVLEKRKSVTAARLAVAPIIACLTLLTLLFYIPRRMAFIACRRSFARFPVGAPTTNQGSQFDGVALDRVLGIYRVDRYAIEPDGGVFFRTGSGGFIDTDSYGFAYRPNQTHGPFGGRHYELHHLTGDWYWFSVTDHF